MGAWDGDSNYVHLSKYSIFECDINIFGTASINLYFRKKIWSNLLSD